MPARDGTGPMGQGAMTGRRMGYCAQNIAPESESSEQPRAGMGMAWGRGGGMGRGLARRRGRGGACRGQGNQMRQA